MKNLTTHLKLLVVATIWGFGWPAGRVLANDIEPFAASWIRYVIAVLCFLVFLRISSQWMIPNKSEWKKVALIGFFSTCVYQAFFMFGMQYTAAGDASLMITFNPFFTALLAIVFLDEKMTSRLAVGLTLGISGVAVLFYYSPNVDISFTDRAIGDLLIAGAALAWACNSILMKKAMISPAENSKEALSPLQLTVWSSVAGLVFLTPLMLIEMWQYGISQPSYEGWISVIFLAIFSTVISYVWFADGILKIGAGKSALYVYLVPPIGIYSGYLLLDEKLSPALLISFILIVGGVLFAQSKSDKPKEAS